MTEIYVINFTFTQLQYTRVLTDVFKSRVKVNVHI